MGGSTSSAQLPQYSTGVAQNAGTPPQSYDFATGQSGTNSGNVYTPKFGQPTYVGGYLPQSDTNFINSVPQIANTTNTMNSQIAQYMPALQSAGGNGQATSYSPQATSDLGNYLSGNALQMAPYESAALQTGFDPQNALYNSTAQQLTDQTRAAEAAAGVAGTPYGAGTEAQTMSKFNLDWLNQEQQRQSAAASTASQLQSTMDQGVAGGQQLAQAGPSFQSSILSTLLGDTTQAANPQQVAASDYLSYMGQQQQAQLASSQQNIAGVSSLLDFVSNNQGGGGSSSSGKSGAGSSLGGIGQAAGKAASGGLA